MKILIVEDDSAAQALLKTLISKKFQCEIEQALNGVEGLDKLEKFKPDVILLDITMPVMNGIEFLRAMRSESEYDKTRVIILSAMRDKNLINDIKELGVDDYLLKPFERSDVIERIKEAENEIVNEKRRESRQQEKIETPRYNRKVLAVIPDKQLLEIIERMLQNVYIFYGTGGGAAGLQLYIANKPEIVLLHKDIPVISENQIIKKIKDIDSAERTRIFFYTENETVPEVTDGILTKSYEPEKLLNEFVRKVTRTSSVLPFAEMYLKYSKDIIRQAALNIFDNEEFDIIELNKNQLPGIQAQLFAVIDLMQPRENFVISVMMYGAMTDMISIGKKLVKTDLKFDEGVIHTLSKYIRSIGEKLKTFMKDRGITLSTAEPKVILYPDNFYKYGITYKLPFKTKTGRQFIAAVSIKKSDAIE